VKNHPSPFSSPLKGEEKGEGWFFISRGDNILVMNV